jgi:diguanylate cyclase (GGDEF)-like protein
MDVNGLKQINDTGGHALGDQALREAGQVIRHTFRDSDIIARLGGDEFAVVAHVTDASSVAAIRERLRTHLELINAAPNRQYTLDMSVGAAVVDASQNDDLDKLLARADAAMYEEKRSVAHAR